MSEVDSELLSENNNTGGGGPPINTSISQTQKQSEYEKEGRNTSSTDPEMMESRIFIGNLASDKVAKGLLVNYYYQTSVGVSSRNRDPL